MDDGITRRRFFKIVGAAGAAATLPGQVLGQAGAPALHEPASAADAADYYHFFTAPEAEFVTAAVDHLIPADDWPSASQAGVVTYIDRQLAGSYGNGSRLYLQGPWAQGTPQQGYQLPLTPAQLYRTAIEGIERFIAREFGGRRFVELPPNSQPALLHALETGEVELESVPAPVFFETLLANTVEGYFADPAYGGNRNMAGWRMIGFPGAYAQFVVEVEQHGAVFDRPPMSMVHSIHGPG